MTGKNDAINESLSALMDGEHTELDLRRVLKAAEADGQESSVMSTWANYHKQEQIHNKELDAVCNDDFLAGIQAAIADEELQMQPPRRQSAFHQFAAKGAMAACFTFVFLIGASQLPFGKAPESVDATLAADSVSPSAVVPSGFELPPLNARTVSSMPSASSNAIIAQPRATAVVNPREFVLSPEMQERLHRMIMRHTEETSANGGLGVLPFSRVDTLDEPESR